MGSAIFTSVALNSQPSTINLSAPMAKNAMPGRGRRVLTISRNQFAATQTLQRNVNGAFRKAGRVS